MTESRAIPTQEDKLYESDYLENTAQLNERKTKSYLVSEYMTVFVTNNRSTLNSGASNKKYTYYR